MQKSSLLLTLLYVGLLVLGQRVVANEAEKNQGYTPKGETRTDSVRATNSRGCEQLLGAVLIVFAPGKKTGLTLAERPKFVWYVSNVSRRIQFTLAASDGGAALIQEEIKVKQPGIVQYQLPPNISLEVEKEYQWTVDVICNTDKPSSHLSQRGWIKRISGSEKLKNSLTEANSKEEQNQILAEAKIWYEYVNTLAEQYDQEESNNIINLIDTELSQLMVQY